MTTVTRARLPPTEILVGFVVLALLISAPIFAHPAYLGVQDWDQNLFKVAAPRITFLDFGQFPLWNPWEAGGFPLLGHPESRFLCPTFALILLFGPAIGVKLEIVVHYALGLWGTYALCKHYRLGDAAALAGSCIYMLSGMLALSIAAGMSVFMSAAFIPWAMLFFLRSLNRSHHESAAGGALALMFLDGGVVFTVLSVFLLALQGVFERLFGKHDARRIARVLTLTYAWAFGFAAIKLLPALDLIRRMPRRIDLEPCTP